MAEHSSGNVPDRLKPDHRMTVEDDLEEHLRDAHHLTDDEVMAITGDGWGAISDAHGRLHKGSGLECPVDE